MIAHVQIRSRTDVLALFVIALSDDIRRVALFHHLLAGPDEILRAGDWNGGFQRHGQSLGTLVVVAALRGEQAQGVISRSQCYRLRHGVRTLNESHLGAFGSAWISTRKGAPVTGDAGAGAEGPGSAGRGIGKITGAEDWSFKPTIRHQAAI